MQGKFGGNRRNYTRIWDQVMRHIGEIEGDASVCYDFLSPSSFVWALKVILFAGAAALSLGSVGKGKS
jgi:hypothetical protein